jgi:CRP-like cAMP-binding protein
MAALSLMPRPVENRLLAALPCAERQHLDSQMQMVQLKHKQMIHLPGESVRYVYFPVTAVLSLVSILKDGSSTEIGTVGNEGMAGLPALLGSGSDPYDMLVQVPGTAHRMLAGTLSEATGRPGPLRDLLLRYTQVFLDQVAQEVACGRHHVLKQRMASWLLMLRDRTDTEQLPVTHEFLGHMLGVGRPTVTLTAVELQRAGLIRYSRGSITILDRQGLEAATCECYRLIQAEYDRLLG